MNKKTVKTVEPIRLRVRYSEVDRMNYCYHVNYLQYFEIGRTEWLRQIWKSYKELEDDQIGMVVIEANLKYHHPAFYDDDLAITIICNEWGFSRINFLYEIRRHGEDSVLCSGSTRLCFVGKDKKPTRIPEELKNVLDGNAE